MAKRKSTTQSGSSGRSPSTSLGVQRASPRRSSTSSVRQSSALRSPVRQITNPYAITESETRRSSGTERARDMRERSGIRRNVETNKPDPIKKPDPVAVEGARRAAVARDVRDAANGYRRTEMRRGVVQQQRREDDNRPHCKKRPDPVRGGGSGKGFVPWCSK